MKKITILAIIALSISAYAEDYSYQDKALTITSSTNSAVATYTAVGAERVVMPYALYQTVADGVTNTVTLSVSPYGESNYYTVDTLAAVTGSSTLETFGVGDVSADIDPIILKTGDILKVSGAGTASSNVTYRLRLKIPN